MNPARYCVILCLFGAAFICCAVKGCRLAGPDRARIIARGEKIARVWRQLPAKRGRILDKKGKILVWSELYWDLHYNFTVAAPMERPLQRMGKLPKCWL